MQLFLKTKYSNLDLIIISKKENKAVKKEKNLNRIENFKIESGYLKICYELRDLLDV